MSGGIEPLPFRIREAIRKEIRSYLNIVKIALKTEMTRKDREIQGQTGTDRDRLEQTGTDRKRHGKRGT